MVDIVVTALGSSNAKPLDMISDLCAKYECNVVNSHMLRLGDEIVFYGLISGNWDAIAKLETSLQNSQSTDLSIIYKRTEPPKTENNTIPYSVQIFSKDVPGIMLEVVKFFNEIGTEIVAWRTFTYTVSNSSIPLYTVYCQINVPEDYNITDLREQFLIFCEDLNFDGTLEPEKP